MKINVCYPELVDEIEFEPFLGKNIKKYKQAFDEWYYDEVVEYSGRKKHVGYFPKKRFDNIYFDTNVIITWIKEVAPQANPRIIRSDIPAGQEDKTLPCMAF